LSRLKIGYGQCWEDPFLSREALRLGPEDDVLAIASGGECGLAFLLDQPKSVTLVDRNPAQIFLLELKASALRELGHDELLGFIGAKPWSDKDGLYAAVRPGLSPQARAFWDSRKNLIRDGLFHCGRYERFFRAGYRYVLPLIHSRKTLRALFACATVEEQAAFYREVWANRRWRALFRVFFGKHVFGRWGRSRSHYRYVTVPHTWRHFYDRALEDIDGRPLRDHPGLAYFFQESEYPRPENYPLWLRPENRPVLREGLDRLRLRVDSAGSLLKSSRPGDYSKFNLSNIFEYMSAGEYEDALRELVRVSRPDGRVAIWTMFVPRPVPESLEARLEPIPPGEILPAYRTWTLFEDFHAWKIR